MAMAQPKAQAPFIPGQKEAADLVPDEEESRNSSSSSSITGSNSSGIPGKFIRFFGNHSSDGKEQGDGDAGRESKLQGDYYSPVRTELVSKGGADAVKDLYYSPGAAVGIVTSELKLPPSAETDEHEQRGEASGTLVSGPGLVEAGKGMASEVMEKLAGLQLPSESLDAVKHTVETSVKGAFTTTKDVVYRTKQSLFDILPSSLSSSNAHHARQPHDACRLLKTWRRICWQIQKEVVKTYRKSQRALKRKVQLRLPRSSCGPSCEFLFVSTDP